MALKFNNPGVYSSPVNILQASELFALLHKPSNRLLAIQGYADYEGDMDYELKPVTLSEASASVFAVDDMLRETIWVSESLDLITRVKTQCCNSNMFLGRSTRMPKHNIAPADLDIVLFTYNRVVG